MLAPAVRYVNEELEAAKKMGQAQDDLLDGVTIFEKGALQSFPSIEAAVERQLSQQRATHLNLRSCSANNLMGKNAHPRTQIIEFPKLLSG